MCILKNRIHALINIIQSLVCHLLLEYVKFLPWLSPSDWWLTPPYYWITATSKSTEGKGTSRTLPPALKKTLLETTSFEVMTIERVLWLPCELFIAGGCKTNRSLQMKKILFTCINLSHAQISRQDILGT